MQPPEPWSWPRTMLTFAASLVAVLLLGRIPLAGADEGLARVLLGAGPMLLVFRGVGSAVAGLNPDWRGAARAAGAAAFFAAAWAQGAREGRSWMGLLTTLAALAIVWLLADTLSRSRRLHGAVSLYAILAWIGIVQRFVALGSGLATGERSWTDGVAGIALLAPLVLALVGGLALPNGQWPLRFGRALEARSALDFVLLALSAALLAGQLCDGALAFLGVTNAFVRPAVALVVVAGALGVYAPRRSPGPVERRLVPPLVLLPSLAFGALALGWVRGAGPAWGPFTGATRADAVVACTEPHAPGDRAVIAQRLRALGIRASVTVLSPRQLHLALEGVSGPQAVLDAVLAPGRLSLQLVSPHPSGPEDPPGFTWCPDGPPCEHLALEPPVLGNADLSEATAAPDAFGDPTVRLAFTPAGSAGFARLTSESVGRRLAIRVDDRVLMVAIVQEPITAGVAVVSFGGKPRDAAEAEAAALAAALNGGALACAWSPEDLHVR